MESLASHGVIASGGYDNTVRLWRPDNGTSWKCFQHADSQVNALAITRDKRTIAAAGNGQIRIFQTNGPVTPVSTWGGHDGNVTTIGFNEGTTMFSGGEDGTIKLWDLRTLAEVYSEYVKNHHVSTYFREYNHQSSVTCAALHPLQRDLFSGDQEGRIVRWDLRQNQCAEHLIPAPDVPLRCIAISADGLYLAAANSKGNCFVWTIQDGDAKPHKRIEVQPHGYVLKCAFSPDGSMFAATTSEKVAKVYDVRQDFHLLATLVGHTMWVWDCVFTADSGHLMTASSDKTLRMWCMETFQSELELNGHQRAVTSVALNDML
jgi:G protein beta subunit-like protein